MNKPEDILSDLIKSQSVTPKDDGAIAKIAKFLSNIGFNCQVLEFQGSTAKIQNLYAKYGTADKNICFAGHTDVVPAGDAEWSFPPFEGRIENGMVGGRGAVDMKGGIASFLVAIEKFIAKQPNPNFAISVLISGNEEGDAVGGTPKILQWLKEQNEKIDFCLMAEPSSINQIGDAYKLGRRGSVNFILKASGVQGHIAEQKNPDNVIAKLAKLSADLYDIELDKGNEFFEPSNLEFSTFDVGNLTENLIPENAEIRFNIRFNNEHRGENLVKFIESKVQELAKKHAIKSYKLTHRISGEAFLSTKNNRHLELEKAIKAVTGLEAKNNTSGGTSDLRFLVGYIPEMAELGLINATMHQKDERTSIADLNQLADIFYNWLAGLQKI
jgi:succinyl-diaminopimelate desuccinylase